MILSGEYSGISEFLRGNSSDFRNSCSVFLKAIHIFRGMAFSRSSGFKARCSQRMTPCSRS
jgi:hypothetical protein